MQNLILVGNSGVGKSSILNLVGESLQVDFTRFESDFALIDGLTTKTTYVDIDINGKKVRLIDAPGLIENSDQRISKNADELTKALRYGGKYKLVFVYQSNSGRLLPQDVFTTAKVCNAIGNCVDVGLIINKVDEDDLEKYNIRENRLKIAQALSKATNGRLNADHIIALEYCRASERQHLKPRLLRFIDSLCPDDTIEFVAPIRATLKEINMFIQWFDSFLTTMAFVGGILTYSGAKMLELWDEKWEQNSDDSTEE